MREEGPEVPTPHAVKGDGLIRAADLAHKEKIDMSRRRIRDVSRRTRSQNEAPPLSMEDSTFVGRLQAWGYR